MGKLIDLTGQRFGRLVVIERMTDTTPGRPRWLCQCDCGKEKVIHTNHLRSGHTRSCGCLRQDELVTRSRKYDKPNSRLLRVWGAMIHRCYIPSDRAYPYYGGRGIGVCEEWQNSFETFQIWALSNGYREGMSIDRIDNNGDYCPQNCRWTNRIVQANNTRANHLITWNGVSHTLMEWSRYMGINHATLRHRIRQGWSVERALTEPVHRQKKTK